MQRQRVEAGVGHSLQDPLQIRQRNSGGAMSWRHNMVPELAWRPQKKLTTWQPATVFRTSGHTKSGLPAGVAADDDDGLVAGRRTDMLEPQSAKIKILIGGAEAILSQQGAPRALGGLKAVGNVDVPAHAGPRRPFWQGQRVLGRRVLGFHQREIHGRAP